MKVFKRHGAARAASGSFPFLRIGMGTRALYIVGFEDLIDAKLTEIAVLTPDGAIAGNVSMGHLDRLGNANHAIAHPNWTSNWAAFSEEDSTTRRPDAEPEQHHYSPTFMAIVAALFPSTASKPQLLIPGADYFKTLATPTHLTPTVVQQTIPKGDMTPIERLLLTNIFTTETHGDELYFYAERNPKTFITIERDALESAIAASQSHPSSLLPGIEEQLYKAPPENTRIDLDLSGPISWELILQDIVRRSEALSYITVVSSFVCTKMRPDGFGGMAVLITPGAIVGKSTNDILEDYLAEAELEHFCPSSSLSRDDNHVLPQIDTTTSNPSVLRPLALSDEIES